MLRPDTPVHTHHVNVRLRQAAVYISLDSTYEPVSLPAACIYYQAYMWNAKCLARWENKESYISRPGFLSEPSLLTKFGKPARWIHAARNRQACVVKYCIDKRACPQRAVISGAFSKGSPSVGVGGISQPGLSLFKNVTRE
jgi:hypothetical protein